MAHERETRSAKAERAALTALAALAALLAGCGGGAPEGPGSTFTTAHFAGAGKCSGCHDGLSDAAGRDVSIAADWASTMMANSSRDPLWRAKVASERRRNPALAGEIDDRCTRCHAPMANVEASEAGALGGLFERAVLTPGDGLNEAALDGVSCTLCHQIEPQSKLGTLEGFSGKYTIGKAGDPVDRPLFGPYVGPNTAPMRQAVSYTPTHSAHVESSELCATCHNLKTPFVDAQGKAASTAPEGEFPEQMVYSEWLHSDLAKPGGKSCAGCHLPQTDGVRIANRPMNLPRRDRFGRHAMVGGNTVMLDLLDKNREELAVTAAGFAATIDETRKTLASSAALSVASARRDGGAVEAQIRVENRAGHKLPSGYPARRVWLHLIATDASGAVVFESGRMSPDGRIEGADADESSAAFEPHHELITQPSQVQIYEAILGDTDGKVTYTLLRAAAYLKDNRLLPAGFDKASAPPDVRVAGGALDDDDFTAGGDLVTYRFAAGAGPVTLSIALRYQPIAHGFAQDLFTDEADPSVKSFKRLYGAAELKAETIVSTSAKVP